ncbi:hypothetical protein HMPREF9441_00961 [Paraprevotella clara YIT 11840]|uniref:Uncharacterized protein n=1 Tax=Paraprevotella clara YIT 11840 TaxID=762968 RepID=G5SNN0_9BACT|nr:hypothetical protein HMPREF9441_00961 [Paraprevotella clara YIT 11840]
MTLCLLISLASRSLVPRTARDFCIPEKPRIFCAKRKIVRLRMIFHSAENDFACCCKRFNAVCQLHHPYNEFERKKGSHPSYKLWFNPLR